MIMRYQVALDDYIEKVLGKNPIQITTLLERDAKIQEETQILNVSDLCDVEYEEEPVQEQIIVTSLKTRELDDIQRLVDSFYFGDFERLLNDNGIIFVGASEIEKQDIGWGFVLDIRFKGCLILNFDLLNIAKSINMNSHSFGMMKSCYVSSKHPYGTCADMNPDCFGCDFFSDRRLLEMEPWKSAWKFEMDNSFCRAFFTRTNAKQTYEFCKQ